MDENDELKSIEVFLFCVCSLLIFSCILSPFVLSMVFSPGASDRWGTLLFRAIAPIIGGGWILAYGVIGLIVCVYGFVTERDYRWYAPAVAITPICVIASILERWISRLVIERVYAVGYNPDNAAAVISFGTIWYALRGLAVGLCLTLVVALLSYGVRIFFRSMTSQK